MITNDTKKNMKSYSVYNVLCEFIFMKTRSWYKAGISVLLSFVFTFKVHVSFLSLIGTKNFKKSLLM